MDDSIYTVEHVALEDTTSLGVSAFKHMSLIVGPDIVDCVEESAAAESRCAARGAVHVVALHGDLVIRSDHLEVPVVVVVAASRVGRVSVDVVVGKSDSFVGVETKDVVLATRVVSLHVLATKPTMESGLHLL